MLKFAPKRLHFHYPAMKGRIQLAVIDHNSNTGRKAATTQTGNCSAEHQTEIKKDFLTSNTVFLLKIWTL